MPKTATQNNARTIAKPAKPINLLTTLQRSLLETFYARGWDLTNVDASCELDLDQLTTPKNSWSKSVKPLPVDPGPDMDFAMGSAIADAIENARRTRQKLALILPVGPM